MKRILVIRLSALGDFVLSFPAFAAIRAHHKNDTITLLTTKAFASLASRAPWFDRVEVDTRPKFYQIDAILNLIAQLRGFDFVYDLQTSGRSSRYFLLAGKPPWSGIVATCSHPHRAKNRTQLHTIERQRDQLIAAGITNVPSYKLDWLKSDVSSFDIPERYALLMPGAAPHRPDKRWPGENFAKLAEWLWSRGLGVAVIGTRHEAGEAALILEHCPAAIDLTGKTTIEQVASLASGAELVVGNDTGPMHLAAVSGARCIVLFGSASNPALTAPRGNVAVLRRERLRDLTIEELIAEIEKDRSEQA